MTQIEQLRQAAELWKQATPNWKAEIKGLTFKIVVEHQHRGETIAISVFGPGCPQAIANAKFACAARNLDLPALLAEMEQLQKFHKTVRGAYARWDNNQLTVEEFDELISNALAQPSGGAK